MTLADTGAESAARAFVAQHGSALDRVRMAVCVGTERPEALQNALGALQGPEGSFVFPETAHAGPVAGTLRALSILATAAELRSEAAERAVTWLADARRADGAWSIPQGGERAGHLATAFLAGFLAGTPFARGEVLEAAGDWLAKRWSPDLVRSGDFAMIAAHTHFFSNAPHAAGDPILQWCGRELERGVRGGRLPALFALRVFSLCGAPVIPGARLGAAELLEPLSAEQSRDGGWLPGVANLWRVEATLEGLAAGRRFGAPASFAGGA